MQKRHRQKSGQLPEAGRCLISEQTGASVEYETLLYSPYQPTPIADGGFQLSSSRRQLRGYRRDLGHFLHRIRPQALLHVLTGGRLDEFVGPKQQY